MKLGDVLKKERVRRKLTETDVAGRLRLTEEQYQQFESGLSPAEEWGPRLALIAIKLKTPTSRLISRTGKFADSDQEPGQCGKLIKAKREDRGLTREEIAAQLEISADLMADIENGKTQLEEQAPLLLGFAEAVEQPIFNLFYPCGLPFAELNDYP